MSRILGEIKWTNEQMGKIDPRCQYKTITHEKWMFKILN
jgi:hypothetical protein